MAELNDVMMKLENEFNSVLFELEEINDDNFYAKFDRVKFLQSRISEDKEKILTQYEWKDLQEYKQKFDILIKQITIKFDTMVSERRNKQTEISRRLNRLLNHKKLVNYQR